MKPAEVKKLENGNLSVRWEGTTEFVEITDPALAAFVIFYILD